MQKPSFTMIELLVTISIIAVLSGLVIINIYGNIAKARDAKRKSDLRELRTSLDLYYNIKGYYPPSDSTLPPNFNPTNVNGKIKGCDVDTSPTACDWGDSWKQDGVSFMDPLSSDPNSRQSYHYQRGPTGATGRTSYIIIAKLERTIDPDIIKSQSACTDAVSGFTFSDPSWYVACNVK